MGDGTLHILEDCPGSRAHRLQWYADPAPQGRTQTPRFLCGLGYANWREGLRPTAPGYSEGDGWIDLTANEVRGTIWVVAGAHYSKELGPSDHHGGPDAGEL